MLSGLFAIPTDAFPCASAALPRRAARGPKQAGRFLAGSENSLVSQALSAVREPAAGNNPLVLTGLSGTGKTLLLDLLVDEFERHFANVTTQKVTAVDFARAYAHAVQTDGIVEFRHRYGRLHLLAIDDLERLTDKPAAQQDLSQLIDSLRRRGGLVVATCRTHPLDAADLSYSLASRLAAGLVIPLALPEDAARRALIEHFAAVLEVEIPAEARDRLAAHAASRSGLTTPPQIRRAIIGLAELARNRGQSIDARLIDEFISSPTASRATPIKAIAAAVSKRLDVSVALLRGKSRLHTVTAARSLAMHLARELTGATYAEIGRYFGNRDHTTVMYACKKAAASVRNDVRLRQVAAQLTAQLAAEEPAP